MQSWLSHAEVTRASPFYMADGKWWTVRSMQTSSFNFWMPFPDVNKPTCSFLTTQPFNLGLNPYWLGARITEAVLANKFRPVIDDQSGWSKLCKVHQWTQREANDAVWMVRLISPLQAAPPPSNALISSLSRRYIVWQDICNVFLKKTYRFWVILTPRNQTNFCLPPIFRATADKMTADHCACEIGHLQVLPD